MRLDSDPIGPISSDAIVENTDWKRGAGIERQPHNPPWGQQKWGNTQNGDRSSESSPIFSQLFIFLSEDFHLYQQVPNSTEGQ
jgi:hypothetical protein